MHHLGWPTKNSGIEIRIPKQNNLSVSLLLLRVTNIYSVQMSRLSPLDYFPAKHASTYTAKNRPRGKFTGGMGHLTKDLGG